MTKKMTELPFRLALRVEGDKWNAYLAEQGTMKGSVWIGSIAMRFVENNEKRKQAFIDLMTDSFGDIIKGVVGEEPSFTVRAAPESECTKGRN